MPPRCTGGDPTSRGLFVQGFDGGCDIGVDLDEEVVNRVESALVSEPPNELDAEMLAIEISIQFENVDLENLVLTAECGSRSEIGDSAIGVAVDEIQRQGWSERKRKRLIDAGADILIPDFSDMQPVQELLGL